MFLLKAYGYLVGLMSLLGFILMGVDKLLAKWDKRRISEKTLLGVGALGGATGSWLGLLLFRHKTKHKIFSLGLPVLMVLHLVILILIIYLGLQR